MSTEVANAQVMPHEADHDIKTMLFLLQAAGAEPEGGTELPERGAENGSAENGSNAIPKWYSHPRAYWRGMNQLVADLAAEKAKVARLQKERNEARDRAYSAGWDRDQAIKERDEARAQLAAWKQAQSAQNQAELAANQRRNSTAQAAHERREQEEHESRARDAQKKAEQKARQEAESRDRDAQKKAEQTPEEQLLVENKKPVQQRDPRSDEEK